MSLYELIFIAKQEVSPVRAKELGKKINDFIKAKGGTIKKEEFWGFKNLAYEVKRNKRGYYLFFVLKAPPKAILELSGQIQLTEDILRHLFIKIKEKEFTKEPTKMMKEEEDE